MIGCVYYVILSLEPTTQVKIGMSNNVNIKRSSAYGESSEVIREVPCGNPKFVETQLIKLFNKKFVKVKGKEYFEGDHDTMIECFDKCINTYSTEATEYNLDIGYLIQKTSQWLDEKLSQDIVPSINDTHSYIRPDIESMISTQMMNCIDYLQSISDITKMNELIVHHDKLVEYEICLASSGSNDIKKRLKALDLIENKDYRITRVRQPLLKGVRGGATSGKNVYMLTPIAFKRILSRSNIPVYQSYPLFEQYLNQIYSSRIYSYSQK